MAATDEFLRGWLDQLAAMHGCMAEISNDTDPALGNFCVQKPSDLLLSAPTQAALGVCLANTSNLSIPSGAIAAAATFRALLDVCYRPLLDAVGDLMRVQATEDGGNYGNMPLNQFGAIKISVAFPSAPAVDGLCERLAAASIPTNGGVALFPANDLEFRKVLAQPNATVLLAAQYLPGKPAAAASHAGNATSRH